MIWRSVVFDPDCEMAGGSYVLYCLVLVLVGIGGGSNASIEVFGLVTMATMGGRQTRLIYR